MSKLWPIFAAAALVSACADPLPTLTKAGQTTPAFYAENVKGYAQTAAGLPPDSVLAWNLVVTGDVATWRECSAVDACTKVERTRPANELLGVEKVAESSATVDGATVDVVRLSLAARPKYIVPNNKPVR